MRKSFRWQAWIFDPTKLWIDVGKGIIVTVFFAWFFYRSALGCIVTAWVGMGYVLWQQRLRKGRSDKELLVQFRECLLSVDASLRAGYAVENAFLESIRDVRMMFGEGSRMETELGMLRQGLLNNRPIEVLLREMGRRCREMQILDFADVFEIAKRGGGSLSKLIEVSAGVIRDRMELEEEIETLLASRRLEQKIMNLAPFALVLYVDRTNPGYFDLLYDGIFGRGMMSACLLVYLMAFGLSEWIFRKAFEERG